MKLFLSISLLFFLTFFVQVSVKSQTGNLTIEYKPNIDTSYNSQSKLYEIICKLYIPKDSISEVQVIAGVTENSNEILQINFDLTSDMKDLFIVENAEGYLFISLGKYYKESTLNSPLYYSVITRAPNGIIKYYTVTKNW